MLNLTYLRNAIAGAGGVPSQVSEIGLLRQLVGTYGGTPTKWEPLALLREAIAANGGVASKVSEQGLLRELLTARGLSTPLVSADDMLRYLGQGGTPTPTPAPMFTSQPSVSPTSGDVGVTLTGTDGVASNSTALTRQWLLNGSAISGATGSTYVTTAAGDYAFRNSASGPGGNATATSAVVTITAPTPTPTATYLTDDAGNRMTADNGDRLILETA